MRESFIKNWNPNFITPGFFVRVRVSGATPYRAALVPDRVISSQQGLKYVFVVKPDNTVERRNLETGGLFEGKRIVKSGLKDGEKVVSTRLQLVASRNESHASTRRDACQRNGHKEKRR